MDSCYQLELVAIEIQRDLQRQAETARLIHSLKCQQLPRRTPVQNATYWLGVRLMQWGMKLQGELRVEIVPTRRQRLQH